jgi:hypothetical protein
VKPIEFLREVTMPARSPAVLFALILFFGLLQIVLLSQVFGMVIFLVLAGQLLVFILPAFLRYLMVVLRARASGREPDPLDIDLFPWVGQLWTLFPVVHILLFIYVVYLGGSYFGSGAALGIALIYAAVLPASLITLAITQSALASLNPATLLRLARRLGFAYLTGPMFVVAASWLVVKINVQYNNDLITEFVGLYLVFAAFAVFGGLARALDLQRELDIPLPDGPDEELELERHLLERTAILNHAYGLISRGNRDKGLQHVFDALAQDPYEDAGWAWFFDAMMQWANPEAALAFAQRYVHELLRNGENVKAVKLMLRCRLVNPAFRPLPEDIDLAAAAARECHNDELASFLR